MTPTGEYVAYSAERKASEEGWCQASACARRGGWTGCFARRSKLRFCAAVQLRLLGTDVRAAANFAPCSDCRSAQERLHGRAIIWMRRLSSLGSASAPARATLCRRATTANQPASDRARKHWLGACVPQHPSVNWQSIWVNSSASPVDFLARRCLGTHRATEAQASLHPTSPFRPHGPLRPRARHRALMPQDAGEPAPAELRPPPRARLAPPLQPARHASCCAMRGYRGTR